MKNAWIIGASHGIGEELVKSLFGDGYNLAISARDEKKLNEIKKALEQNPMQKSQILVAPLDVSDLNSFKNAFKKISENFLKIDLAIFASGIYQPMDLKDFDIEFAQKTLDVNLGGCLNFLHLIVPKMTEQKSGHIALIASVAGYRGLPQSLAYGASKAAIINLAEGIYPELKSNGIAISVINPGFVKTRLTDSNKFSMPFLISTKEAAEVISNELKKGKFEIHFPKKFTFFLKFLRLIPNSLFLKFITKFIYKNS
jgi:short-subunit dehydrogenase